MSLKIKNLQSNRCSFKGEAVGRIKRQVANAPLTISEQACSSPLQRGAKSAGKVCGSSSPREHCHPDTSHFFQGGKEIESRQLTSHSAIAMQRGGGVSLDPTHPPQQFHSPAKERHIFPRVNNRFPPPPKQTFNQVLLLFQGSCFPFFPQPELRLFFGRLPHTCKTRLG
ncbi:hypothetical protein DR999_PMT10782 [Platysternon megacephalum]|uniref:Uncharacterized protein n=1 Tax=Platysternon megacephalum TaxID=55544 RepID=A0A4D9E6F7_9SAUR|nr:hypothetical protein DR999_PMT10782 [Platysternon megacephalum]